MAQSTVYVCPTDKSLQCSWEGASEDILEHFIIEHEDLLFHSSEVDIDLGITSENRLLFLDEEIYLMQFKIVDHILKIGLRYLGPIRISKAISYDIVIKVDGHLYFYNYFDKEPSIFGVANGFWTINLHLLKLLHQDLTSLQCNFSISKDLAEINAFDDERTDPIDERDNKIQGDDEAESSDQDTVIESDEIDEILNEDVELRNKKDKPEDIDALDNISNLNFSLLENSRCCRRYSSIMSIPRGLFYEKDTIDLSCSNCFINMLPPIYLCANNHNICADCRNESCKVCSGAVSENRNKDLEDYSRRCLHLCRYHSEGCMESFMYNEIRNHEIKCTFCIYKCIEDCTFRGKYFEFPSHVKLNHSSCEIFYSTSVDFSRRKEFFVCDKKLGIFYCTSTFLENTIRWTVKYLGPADRNYSCEITFKKTKSQNVLLLKRLEDKYSIAYTKEDLKKMKVKDKNAVLTISSYFN